ncbi:GNAT family N-acetyltransferase [Micromonospora narathiwatensis]|uniref:Predicted acetyltransferase, GNAT family n=1 Tax=Micromonospora narathiwatensis TaxID=299146 RepID=A0A1A8ZR23_9ACTN|nr:GNAT family N-acetyltransferase [Micromonospora narathiwatensis]SBT46570.1 Predicted acetyltransferase, GNAT family [Micromonospora narathiwatensis]
MRTISTAGPRLEFRTDPGEFLAAAGDHLAAAPVVSTVVASVAHRLSAQRADGIAQPDRNWWLVVRDPSGAVVGVGMRAAPFAPYPPFLLPMPNEAAVALAHALHGRGEEVLAVNGALPAVELCATELTRIRGGRVEVGQHTRLHELGELVCPAPVPGRLELATEDDVDLVTEWFGAFMGDADEQAGRPRGTSAHEVPDRAELLRQLGAGSLWFWVDETGQPVHLTGVKPPSFGVARVGPVYTPPAQRGRGWASNAVAEVSRLIQAAGARVCLFTDQANPTSNKIYAALGYRPVVDMANLVIVR